MTGLIPTLLRWPLRIGAAAAAGTVVLATAVPGAFGEAGSSNRDQAQQALKQVQANAAAIHHASDQAKGLSGKANAAAQHARDAADKAAKLADQVVTAAGDYATKYVEIAAAVATVTADAAAADAAAQSAQSSADTAAAAMDQLLQYTSLANDAVQQTTADVKVADQDTTAVTDALNQNAVSDQWAADSTTQLATVQTSYDTATQSQTDAMTAQQTTQTDAASSTTLIRAAYRTSGTGLTLIPISTGGGGSTGTTGDTSGTGTTTGTGTTGGSGGSGTTGTTTGDTSGTTPDTGGTTPDTGGTISDTGGTIINTDPGSGGPPADTTAGGVSGASGPVDTGVEVTGTTNGPTASVAPPAPRGGIVLIRPRSTAPVATRLLTPSASVPLAVSPFAAAAGQHPTSRPAPPRTPSASSRTTARPGRLPPIGRQRAQAAPVGILDKPLGITDLGAVPILSVLLLVEILILGRRFAGRRR